MNKSETAYSISDIYNFLSSGSIDIEKSIMEVDYIAKVNYNKELLFDKTYSIILFIPSPHYNENLSPDSEQNIGHFTLLSLLDEKTVEFFDSLAGEIPEIVKDFALHNNLSIKSLKNPLQSKKSYICAKYCISRMQSLPLSLKNYEDLLRNHKVLSPDEIIHFLYKNKK